MKDIDADTRNAALEIAHRSVTRYGWPNPLEITYQAFKPGPCEGYGVVRLSGMTRTARGAPIRLEIPVPIRGGRAYAPGVFSVGPKSYVLADPGVSQAIFDHDAPLPGSEVLPSPDLSFKGKPARDELDHIFVDLGGLGRST